MSFQVLTPGVKYAKEADLCSEVLGVTGHLEHGFGASPVEQVVDESLVAEGQRRELMGKGKDDVEVGHGQQFCRALPEPLGTRVSLALGAVPVATRVIRNGLMSAAYTLIAMSTKGCSAASHDGIEHLAVGPCKMSAVLFQEAVACDADDVGHLKGGPAHRLIFLRERFTASGLETAMPSIGLATAWRWRRDRWR